MSDQHDWMAGMTDFQRGEVARLESRIVSFQKRWESLEADWNDCKKALATAMAVLATMERQRDEARREAQFVDSRHLFIGGSLDGAKIDTDAHIYHVDGERYHRGWQAVVVTDHEDELNPLVIAKAVVYRLAGEEWRSLTTAELQRLRFVEYRRVGPLKGEGGGA